MASNTFAILKWQLVNPTYKTIGEYVYESGLTYDHFFISKGENNYYVYIVKKLTSGYTAATSSSSSWAWSGGITSYHRFGQLRMKHQIVN